MTDSRDQRETQSITRIMVRPYASALPLGCFAFGVGNALLSAFGLHWIPVSDTRLLAIILLAFVAPLELIPCIMAFLSRDAGGATAMGVFSAAWVVQGIQFMMSGPSSISPALGIFVLLLALILVILAIVSFPGKPLLGVLLVIAASRSFAAATVQFGFGIKAEITTAIAGWLLAAFAFYSGLGFLLEETKRKSLPLTFRRGEAKEALEGDLKQQLENLPREPGVRDQL